ncbi:MAG: chitobiase/beta-hexosaminidase C-terminal domain-containing protein [Flavobacteriaceae bacterium]|nr:chitobiase/beta-hexosaminidase C-terminal domain-containing protein [Flavobacteriaceae bacterium]
MRNSALKFSLILFLVACCGEKPTKYLAKGEISLAPPRTQFNNRLIDSFVMLQADLHLKNVSIHYTSDGQSPTRSSLIYNEPIKVIKPSVYKFRAFHSDWKPSEITTVEFYKKGHIPSEIIWNSKENAHYKGQGKETLINGKKASIDFRDPQWVGFDSIVSVNVIFDKLTMIKSIDIGYLKDQQSWIFPPKDIELIVQTPKNTFEKLQFKGEVLKEMEERAMKNLNVDINKEVKSIQFTIQNVQALPEWHEGKGNKAWLFMDELIFN